MKCKETNPAHFSPTGVKASHAKLTTTLILLLMVIASGLHLRFAWNRYQQIAESEVLQLSQSMGALLPAGQIASLVKGHGNREMPEYLLIKENLINLVEVTDSIYFAYIISEQDGTLSVLVDSNPDDSSSYSPLGQPYADGMNLDYAPFQTGSSVLTKPVTNQWGTWVRALTHIKDPATGESLGVLAISYSASQWQANIWKRIAPDVAVVICLLLLILSLLNLWVKHSQLQRKSRDLAFQEALYRNVFEQAPIGIALANRNKGAIQEEFSSINPVGEAILGRNIDELRKTPWAELTHTQDLEEEFPQFEQFVKGEIGSYSIEKRLIKPDGSVAWVHIKVAGFSGSPLHDSMYLCLLEDISARKQSEEALRESERSKSVFLSHIPGMAYRCKHDQNWTMEFVSEGCHTLTGYKAESLLDNGEVSYNDIISPEYRELVQAEWERVLLQRKRYHDEYEIITGLGERKWVLELGQGVYDAQGHVEALEGIVLDISEQKEREYQVAYLHQHDFLTGLYNRHSMERERQRLDCPEFQPLSLAICDIDGLRMINDAYGHAEGDRLIVEVAKLIQGCCRESDVFGRISGGEFALLLPHTDGETAHQLVQEIQERIKSYNRTRKGARYEISLSIGHGTKSTNAHKIEDTMKTAEEYLRSKKLLNQNSSHSAIVSSIMATLYAKSQETEEHGQRLCKFCRLIGEELGLGQKSLDDLQLLSKLHDIGKIGIDDRILNKPGKLSEKEWDEMKQHPEIGYRIAMATPQLEHVAKYILHHHERWDGSGYPAGLKGPEIPIISRILAIADAYDAMTEDRIYRKALPKEAALKEIERNIGTQFDPDISKLFLRLISEQ